MEQKVVEKVCASTLKQVREKVDFIYELTRGEGGYTGSMHKNGTRFSLIVGIMVSRGILLKTKQTARLYNYVWNGTAPAPTKVLYGSIAQEMVHKENSYHREKKPQAVAKPEPVTEQKDNILLAMFSEQQLWDELKARGCFIRDGKLARNTVLYFE